MKSNLHRIVAIATISLSQNLLPTVTHAVESGTETYLLGSRDSMAGVLPPPGTYLNNDFQYYSASAPSISLGGAAIVGPKLNALVYKFNLTHVTKQSLWGGSLAFNVNVPVAKGKLRASGEMNSGLSGNLQDTQVGMGDITFTPIIGWHDGNSHTSLAFQFFLPFGNYNTADVDVATRAFDVLNIGKNRFAFDPTVSRTYLNPETGFELTGALGVTFSAKNKATNYQTAPEMHFEGTVAQHLKGGWVAGFTGYAYQQIGDDSGAGARSIKSAFGAKSLRAQVYGVGPIVSYSTKLGDQAVSFKLKYIKEFGGKRRFEGQKLWFTAGVVF